MCVVMPGQAPAPGDGEGPWRPTSARYPDCLIGNQLATSTISHTYTALHYAMPYDHVGPGHVEQGGTWHGMVRSYWQAGFRHDVTRCNNLCHPGNQH